MTIRTASETYDVASQAAPSAAGQSLQGTRLLQETPGAGPAYQSDASGDADAGAAHMMALRPGTLVSLNRPLGALENDVMIAAIGITPSSIAITAPPGWTLIRRTDNAGGASNSLAIYYKAVTSAEPAGYNWSFPVAATAVGGSRPTAVWMSPTRSMSKQARRAQAA